VRDAFVGLGANIDQPAAQLQVACQYLREIESSALIRLSRIYQSSPLGPQDQPDFFNACAHLQTTLTPEALLESLQQIEQRMGKRRVRHWGERCIDLDLLLCADQRRDTKALQLPHPGIYDRAFVLRPLADLVGLDYVMPNGDDIATLLAQIGDQQVTVTSINPDARSHSGTIGEQ